MNRQMEDQGPEHQTVTATAATPGDAGDIERLLRQAHENRYRSGLDPDIAALDMTPVRYLLVRQHGWLLERALAAEHGFLVFLQRIRHSPDEPQIPATADIDAVWHASILITPFYVALSQKLFGRYLHHWPFDVPTVPLDTEHT